MNKKFIRAFCGVRVAVSQINSFRKSESGKWVVTTLDGETLTVSEEQMLAIDDTLDGSCTVVPAGAQDMAIVAYLDGEETSFHQIRIVAWNIIEAPRGSFQADPILAGDGPASNVIVGIQRADGVVDSAYGEWWDSVEHFKARVKAKAIEEAQRAIAAGKEALA